MHSTSVNRDIWWLLTSVPYGALQDLTELFNSRCFCTGIDATGRPGICYVRSKFRWEIHHWKGTGDQNKFIVNQQSDADI